MAEVAPTVPVTAPAAAVSARGRGKPKKGKGKLKAKGKGKKPIKAVPLGEDGLPLPKPVKEVKKSLKQQVEEEVGDRDIQEVIKEARAKVDELQAAVEKAQADEVGYETEIIKGKTKMEEASAAVDSCVHKETLALEKFKAAMQALTDAKKKTIEKQLALGEEERALDVLASEGEKNKGEADLIKAQEEAKAAQEAAKKAYVEAQARAKAVAEEMKAKRNALALTDDPEAAEKAKAQAEKDAQVAQAQKEAKELQKNAAKDLSQQIKELEKQRAERDKQRAQAFKDAAGLAKGKKRSPIGDVPSPAKAARSAPIQDVD